MDHQLIAPALKAAQSCTGWIAVLARLAEIFARRKRLIGLAVAAFQHSLLRASLWLVSQSVGRVAPLLARWQQRPPVQSALDQNGKPTRRRSNKVNKDRSGKRARKAERPAPDQCTWLPIDELVCQGSIRPGVHHKGTVQCRGMVNQVDRIDCSIDTRDLAHSHIHLSYFIKDSQTGEQRRVEHSVGLATSGGSCWFVDAGRFCKKLCLAPGGDRLAHPEVYGIELDSQGNPLAQPARREPRKVRVTKQAAKKVAWRLARYRAQAASRCMALYKYGRWRTAIPSLTRTLKRQLAWIGATLLAFWKRAGTRKIVAPPLRL
jgi:hypothetical protein